MAKENPSPSPTPREKSDLERGVEGLERQGRTGTVNENAERQLNDLDRDTPDKGKNKDKN